MKRDEKDRALVQCYMKAGRRRRLLEAHWRAAASERVRGRIGRCVGRASGVYECSNSDGEFESGAERREQRSEVHQMTYKRARPWQSSAACRRPQHRRWPATAALVAAAAAAAAAAERAEKTASPPRRCNPKLRETPILFVVGHATCRLVLLRATAGMPNFDSTTSARLAATPPGPDRQLPNDAAGRHRPFQRRCYRQATRSPLRSAAKMTCPGRTQASPIDARKRQRGCHGEKASSIVNKNTDRPGSGLGIPCRADDVAEHPFRSADV
ncbi:hypothetical protein NA57DRAFT_53657 [Rhizodiscina lignyota]|uniref:Uncharacterized protein n=1 Tax=Rhizodiscina lignyota TaxID=1504668 RepID=A0A9P4IL38_9PEZI|nr:hypothetical protein NA57DRAFT_53657 [Rhizodiscina lignyota]